MAKGAVILITGLPGEGKARLANLAAETLGGEALIESEVQSWLGTGLAYVSNKVCFRREKTCVVESCELLLRSGWIAGMLATHGTSVIISAVAPFGCIRSQLREICKARDCRFGLVYLFGRSLSTEKYDDPVDADLKINVEKLQPDECVKQVLTLIESL